MIIATYESRCRRELAGLNSGAMGFVVGAGAQNAVEGSVLFVVLVCSRFIYNYKCGQRQAANLQSTLLTLKETIGVYLWP